MLVKEQTGSKGTGEPRNGHTQSQLILTKEHGLFQGNRTILSSKRGWGKGQAKSIFKESGHRSYTSHKHSDAKSKWILDLNSKHKN